ncbi:MAG: DUF4124 domain-containing protein [Ramlibacter sp.]
MKYLRIISVVLACIFPAVASAQWIWLDKGGRKVFSDQAPSADVPAKNILKQPGVRAVAAPPVEAPAEAASAAARAARPAASMPRITGKDKDLEEKKKQTEAAEAEKKKAEEEKVAKARAENCSRARQSKANYDSGSRMARTNANGEREILDDAARASEVKRLQDIIAADCK